MSLNDMVVKEPEHARLSPSGAYGWTGCPAYPRMAELYGTDTAGEPAEQGTAGHEVLELCLNDGENAEYYRGSVLNRCDEFPEGFEVDTDMIEAVQMALDYIRARLAFYMEQDELTYLIAERKVNPGTWMGREDCWGTADITIVCPTIGVVEIYDYKHGAGVFVPVDNNKQLLLYLIGVLVELPPEQLQNIQRMTIGIIQPRCFRGGESLIREQEIAYAMINEWIAYFVACAALTDQDNPPQIPGEEQCQWCDGKAHCKALSNEVLKQLDAGTSDVSAPQMDSAIESQMIKDVKVITPAQMVAVLQNAELIRSYVKACESYATDGLMNNTAPAEVMAAFKLVEGGSRRKFRLPEEETMNKLKGKKLLKEDYSKEVLLGIPAIMANAKKVLLKDDGSVRRDKLSKRQMANLESLIEKPKGKLTMVPMADKRDAAVAVTAEEMFDQPSSAVADGDDSGKK